MNKWKICTLVILAGLGSAWLQAASAALLFQAEDAKTLAGTATLSGQVESPKSFKAAQVHIMNVDKNILYMVYTNSGHYRAVDLFPGHYEVTVRKPGFATDTQKVLFTASGHETLNFSLQEATVESIGQQTRSFRDQTELKLVPYDELYPLGPGREVIQRTCVVCHGQDFLPGKQWTAAQWKVAVDFMTGAIAADPNRPDARIVRQLLNRAYQAVGRWN